MATRMDQMPLASWRKQTSPRSLSAFLIVQQQQARTEMWIAEMAGDQSDNAQPGALALPKQAYLTITVKDHDREKEVSFINKSTEKLEFLMDTYCKQQGVRRVEVPFRYGNRQVQSQDTPASLGMRNGDKLEIGQERPISIKVIDGDSEPVVLLIQRTEQFKEILDAYCVAKSMSTSRDQTRFIFKKGKKCVRWGTPETLGMSDGDSLEVHRGPFPTIGIVVISAQEEPF